MKIYSMEISFLSEDSIKIRTKKAILVVDPDESVSADVALLTSKVPSKNGEKSWNIEKIVVDGPGEYEVGEAMIKAKQLGDTIAYRLEDQDGKLLLLAASVVSQVKEEDEYKGVVIHMDEAVDDSIFSKFSSKLFVLYGPLKFLNMKDDGVVRASRINLNTHQASFVQEGDNSGSVIVLSKN